MKDEILLIISSIDFYIIIHRPSKRVYNAKGRFFFSFSLRAHRTVTVTNHVRADLDM